ncbi:MAG: hypothetical protein KGI27_12590 [Thaumarchaeota archaeon]|nr:hypothetical protein [Nitrososphaerota archaeon]
MSEDKISSFLKTGPDWGRLKTSIPGVFVLKMPEYKGIPPRLAVDLNPVDERGSPTKKRGLLLRSKSELEQYREIFQFDKISLLLENVDKINPAVKKQTAKSGEDVLEL